jgi:hypothetical protein
VQGKQHRTTFPKEGDSQATKLLGLIHSNIWGRAKTLSLSEMKYLLSFTNDFSRKSFCYLLKTKGNCFFIDNQTRKNIKVLRNDNDGEFVSRKIKQIFKEHGIHHQTSTPYTT